jgi:hypothetical protein
MHLHIELHSSINIWVTKPEQVCTYIFSVIHDRGYEHAVKLHPFHVSKSTLAFSTLREDYIGQQQLCQYMESTST